MQQFHNAPLCVTDDVVVVDESSRDKGVANDNTHESADHDERLTREIAHSMRYHDV